MTDKCKTEPTKPCEIHCPKCGATDIHRTYVPRMAAYEVPHYDSYTGKRILGFNELVRAETDLIHHRCRCCRNWWNTPTLLDMLAKEFEP